MDAEFKWAGKLLWELARLTSWYIYLLSKCPNQMNLVAFSCIPIVAQLSTMIVLCTTWCSVQHITNEVDEQIGLGRYNNWIYIPRKSQLPDHHLDPLIRIVMDQQMPRGINSPTQEFHCNDSVISTKAQGKRHSWGPLFCPTTAADFLISLFT